MTISDQVFSTHALTTKASAPDRTPWWVTVVYGPQEEAAKIEFLQEIRDLRVGCLGPWMICGDLM